MSLALLVLVALSGSPLGADSGLIEDEEAVLYLPVGLDASRKAPLVVALSPGADAAGMIGVWKEVADEFGWIVLASKRFRNGPEEGDVLGRVAATVRSALARYPADPAKIVVTGVSGGAMGAHYFALRFPDLAAAVVANVGKMRDDQLAMRPRHPRGKLAVFLASPEDFRYAEMKRNRNFLAGLGWQTKWIEFTGGHAVAPPSSYREAAEWLNRRL